MMKKLPFNTLGLFNLLLIVNSIPSFSQDFTWIKGTNLISQTGIYGNIGVATTSNNPGSRDGAVSWRDANGNFWMFGGEGRDFIGNSGLLNDLWKYSPASNQWTWVKGDDIIAQIGSYGTKGISAPSNKPGGRTASVSWADQSGNLWLLGGYGYDGTSALGYLNDLWKYTINNNEWTWMSGSGIAFQAATYGTIGVSSPSNTPGGRFGSVSWVDGSNDLYLCGGYGNSTASTTVGSLNDVWKYTISSNEWTWIKGTNQIDQNGAYGTLGVSSSSNSPGGRNGAVSWKDATGNFWMFGGEGWDAASTTKGLLSDLWTFNKNTLEWTWVKGNNSLNVIGVYGSQGTGNPANFPGGRWGATSWTDAVGSLWLFAGMGYPGAASSSTVGGLNDLWKYTISINEWTWVRGSAVVNQQGSYGTQGIPAFTNIPGGRNSHVSWIDASSNLWFFGGNGLPAAGNAGRLNDLWKYTNCFISPITMTITSSDSVICAGESTSLTVIGSNNYQWTNSSLSTTPFIVINPPINTTYSVFTTDNNGCKYVAAFTQSVLTCAGIDRFSQNTFLYSIYPNPNKGEFKLGGVFTDNSQIKIYNTLGEVVFEQILNASENIVKSTLSKGIYYYHIKQANITTCSGKLIIE